jgi:hypothetical protein
MSPLKTKFNIVFAPKDRRYTKCKKFMISVNRLADYIGKSNEAKVLFLLENSLDERWQMKFRKHGKLYIYSK